MSRSKNQEQHSMSILSKTDSKSLSKPYSPRRTWRKPPVALRAVPAEAPRRQRGGFDPQMGFSQQTIGSSSGNIWMNMENYRNIWKYLEIFWVLAIV